jgi:DamX protein
VGGYAIQLIGVSNRETLLSFARKHGLEGDLAYIRTELDGHDWYVLLYGMFDGLREAKEAFQALPESLQLQRPWIRTVTSKDDLIPF